MSPSAWVALIPLAPLCGAALNGCFGHRLPRALVAAIACGSVLASAIAATSAFAVVLGGEAAEVVLFPWIEVAGLELAAHFVVDRLSGLMVLMVTWVGLLIHVYSWGYMAHERALARYYAYLNLFMFAMLVLVLGASLPLMFVGWEGVGLCSYLLIGFWYDDAAKAAAGMKAFVVNRVGDFGFIVAMLLLFAAAGTLDFTSLARAGVGGTVATAAALMLLLGATGKSAQIPLFVWLPDAMAGPTPVSALIHAATMVTAGVYMTCRMSFLFMAAPTAMFAMACIGVATAVFAASIGTAQNDIKKVLAYSTVSQLGFMFIAAGVGAYAVALFHVITHAFFKACLFLGSGSVIHAMGGEQDMRKMGGLARSLPVTSLTFVVATLAITGFPLTAGFISKDAILWNAFAAGEGAHAATFASAGPVLWALGTGAAGLTAFYMWRATFLTFFSGGPRTEAHAHESPWAMTLPLILLATLSLAGGALGWPHLLGGADWIAVWLQPVVGASPAPPGAHAALEWGLMGASTAIAALGFGVAWWLYARGLRQVALPAPLLWLRARAEGKWHIDEFYDVALVRPLVRTSRQLLFEGVDRRLIDGAVHCVGWLAAHVGILGQLLQNGRIQRYLALFAVMVLLLVAGWFRLRPELRAAVLP
jgi:NADH-quinone oxidoreductase subunit L